MSLKLVNSYALLKQTYRQPKSRIRWVAKTLLFSLNTIFVLVSTLSTAVVYSLFMWSSEGVEEQFFGSVTNVKAFSSSFVSNSLANIEDLSLHPCEHQGDLLAWDVDLWEVKGHEWILVEESQKSVCHQENTYLLAL